MQIRNPNLINVNTIAPSDRVGIRKRRSTTRSRIPFRHPTHFQSNSRHRPTEVYAYNHFAVPWAWAFDTPHKWTKQVRSFFGGTRQGMAISWPGRLSRSLRQKSGGIIQRESNNQARFYTG